MLHKLVFDTTDATSIADSANVGAYLRSADGTLLTHTDVSGKKALDVRVAEGINVEVDLSHTDDSVKIGDGTDFLAIAADGSIAVTDNGGSLTVDAVNLDIRDLVAATDSVSSWTKDGSGTSINSTSNALNVYVTGSGALTVNDAALANTAVASAAKNATGTASDLITSPLASRKYLLAYNNGAKTAYIGATGVTAAGGFPIPPGSMLEMRAGAAIDIEMITAGTTQEMRTLEFS